MQRRRARPVGNHLAQCWLTDTFPTNYPCLGTTSLSDELIGQKLPKHVLVYVGFLVVTTLLIACVGGPTAPDPAGSSTATPAIVPSPTPSFDELKTQAAQIPYNDLFRNNETHVGKQVWYRAKVVQVLEEGEDEFHLRANVTEREYLWDDTVFLFYSGPRILEEDIIEFVGIVEELINYESIFGQKITIPAIRVVASELIAESGEPVASLMATTPPEPTPTVSAPTPSPASVSREIVEMKPTPVPTPTQTPRPTHGPTPTPTATSIPPPTPTPTPLPPGFTIDNPVKAGGVLHGADGTEIVATAIVEDAWELIHANQQVKRAIYFDYIEPPAEGNRFYMITIDMAFNYGEGSLTVEDSHFRLMDKNRVLYHPHQNSCGPLEWTLPRDIITNSLRRELFIGGRTRGNICFEISEDESNLLLVHQPESTTKSLRFLTLDPLANGSPSDLTTISVEPRQDSLSFPPGFTVDNPVEAGGTLNGSDGTGIVATAIVEQAWELIQPESEYNDPPAEGYRFYMVTVEVAYNIGEGFISVKASDFALTGDHRAVYLPHWDWCGITPNELAGEVFIGAKIKGNICFEIPESESNMILIHQPGASGHVNTWLRGWRESRRFLSLE